MQHGIPDTVSQRRSQLVVLRSIVQYKLLGNNGFAQADNNLCFRGGVPLQHERGSMHEEAPRDLIHFSVGKMGC